MMRRTTRGFGWKSLCALALSALLSGGLASGAEALAAPANGAEAPVSSQSPRLTPTVVRSELLPIHINSLAGLVESAPRLNRDCNQIASYTDANFSIGGGTFIAQAGFAENEIAAVSYNIPPAQFPLKVDLMEVIMVTVATTVSTTTEWSILVWDGPPSSGSPVATFSSDDIVIPHVTMPPGNNGTNLQFSIDPGDPEQIILTNASGTGIISFGFRIDKHNNQTANPCFTAPPSGSNAFPCTDNSGLASATGNWLNALDCGIFGCAAGWSQFASLGLCQPSGDWCMRMSWSSLNCTPGVGACCEPGGTCSIQTVSDCNNAGGTFQGDGTDCASSNCVPEDQACCFPSTGGCLDLNPDDCTSAGGIPGGVGTTCATSVCFPEGACCLPDGSCEDNLTPAECAALNGTFQGDGTTCATTNCPEPEGACCFASGGCLILHEGDCQTAGGTWAGANTDCSDNNANGDPDACEPPACPADMTGDGVVDSGDLSAFITAFIAGDPIADFTNDGVVDSGDLADFINHFLAGC